MNYRDKAPEFFKDLNSAGIMSFFEDERTSEEEKKWFKDILTSPDYQLKDNPISKYNWGKIKTVFAREFFPDIAPTETKAKILTMSERISTFLNS
jgi:hypothetical protein